MRRVRNWPVAYKLTLAVLVLVLLPLTAVALLNIQASQDAVEKRERRALESLARGGARLLGERVDGAVRVARLLAHDPVIVASLTSAASTPSRAEVPEAAHAQLINVAQSDGSFEHVYLLDDKGRCVGSSLSEARHSLIGEDFSNRPYYTEVIASPHIPYVTDLLKSKNTPGTAIYLSAAVLGREGLVVGVAVLKVRGDALHSLVKTLSYPDKRAWLIDREGIVVSEAIDGEAKALGERDGHLWWATRPLSPETLDSLAAAERFRGVDERGAEVDYLVGVEERIVEFPYPSGKAAQVGDIGSGGSDRAEVATESFRLPGGNAVIAGIAHVVLGDGDGTARDSYGNIVIVAEQEEYLEPMRRLGNRGLQTLVLGVLAVCVALVVVARGISRRIGEIADAARAAASGDLSTDVPVRRNDELGALARAFNAMTRHLSIAVSEAESGRKEAELAREIAERHHAFIAHAFGRFVAPALVDRLLAEPEALALGGERQRVTILMSDLRGFSSSSDRLEPEKVVTLLNIYLRHVTEIIARYQGTIDEIVGDALLVIFGAPVPSPDHAERAVACALAMQRAMSEINDELRAEGLPRLQMGIGINTGDVVVGNIGSDKRLKYAVVGRNVNLTARIESCTVGGQVLVSESTLTAAGDHLRIEGAFDMWPKGATARLRVHDVTGIGGEHQLYLERTTDREVALPQPIPIQFGVLDGVSVPDLDEEGYLVRLSAEGATIRTKTEPRIMSTLKLLLMRSPDRPADGEIYAKVMSYAPADLEARIRFSSISPELEDLVVALLATGEF